ncbi:MAG: DNA-binding domain-containing protein [Dokdonella sp.]
MIALGTLEQHFLSHVRGGPTFPREWCAQGLVDSTVGLSIYANAYGARLHEALEADHPILSKYLGDSLWAEFCDGYIETHPSQVRSLRHFGVQGAAWLSLHEPFSKHPLLAELAAFERTLLDVFDAADAERIDWSVMQSLDASAWPALRLYFHPSLRLLPTATNAVDVWRALKDEQSPPAAASSATTARLLWRDLEHISRFRPVEAPELVALSSMFSQQEDFATLCERLASHHAAESVPMMAIGFLRQWFDEGIVCNVSSGPRSDD